MFASRFAAIVKRIGVRGARSSGRAQNPPQALLADRTLFVVAAADVVGEKGRFH
jgi:hypothetical protein